MKINRPTEEQKAALNKFSEHSLTELAQFSNNRITSVNTAHGKTFCKLNGEVIRVGEAHKLLSELFE